jgi:glycosyltransferase involved in cell wall biosynthesis
MNIPKVTIATITYNSEKFVAQAIESVLAQSFTDFEYLISDDCSTDGTWDIIQTYKDPRIRAWRNAPNLGEYPNRNKTLYEAKGKYIIWIDGDDIFYPHGLEFMVKMLEAFPDAAMACARPYWPNMIYPYVLSPLEAFRYEFLGTPVLVNGFPDTLIKTEALIKVGGLPENYIAGDTLVKQKIASSNPVLLISQHVSWWRKTPGQASSKLKQINGVIETYDNNVAMLNDGKCPLSDEEQALALYYLKYGLSKYIWKYLIVKGQFMKALKIKNNKRISFKQLLSVFYKKRDFYRKGSEIAPLKLSFNKNPFSNI